MAPKNVVQLSVNHKGGFCCVSFQVQEISFQEQEKPMHPGYIVLIVVAIVVAAIVVAAIVFILYLRKNGKNGHSKFLFVHSSI